MEIDRNNLKLMASGKYLDLNKGYNQEQHNQFIEGAMFAFDFISAKTREKKKQDNEVKENKDETN